MKKKCDRNYRYSLKTVIILICLLFFALRTSFADILPLNELIARTQERYKKTQDIKAQFIQEVTIKSVNKTEREEGVVYVKNPRRMLWVYSKPKAKKLIINPKKAWLYIPEDRAAYVQDTENIYRSKLAVKFLSGIGKLSEDFHVGFSKPDTVDRNGDYLLTLVPKVSDTGVDKLYLTIDKEDFQIIQCSFTDLYGNMTRIRLADIRINNNLDDKLFNFKPPSGVEVFNMP
ncbi:MAG: outer membrane lipoprotein carrier protein LolA [Deltaproteobacteria bacterium]|nr:MAG: outer membrane lipoprotein carrier protein LolA [Deltaproteobacteria bacterium]